MFTHEVYHDLFSVVASKLLAILILINIAFSWWFRSFGLRLESIQSFCDTCQHFLAGRFLEGTCPKPYCSYDSAYEDQYEMCGNVESSWSEESWMQGESFDLPYTMW